MEQYPLSTENRGQVYGFSTIFCDTYHLSQILNQLFHWQPNDKYSDLPNFQGFLRHVYANALTISILR